MGVLANWQNRCGESEQDANYLDRNMSWRQKGRKEGEREREREESSGTHREYVSVRERKCVSKEFVGKSL